MENAAFDYFFSKKGLSKGKSVLSLHPL